MKTRRVLFVAVLVMGILGTSSESRANALIASPSFTVDTHASVDADLFSCSNSPGPQITLEGDWSLAGGFILEVTLRQNKVHGTTVDTVLDPITIVLSDDITIPKQPVRCNDEGACGVGGNSHIWVQLVDGNGNPIGDELYVGRCKKGGSGSLDADILATALAVLTVQTSCTNNPGPFITFGGTIVVSEGVSVRIRFANNLNGTHETSVTRDIVLIAEGSGFTIPKQPSRGGVGGNPTIIIQFKELDGTPIGSPINLGKCNKI